MTDQPDWNLIPDKLLEFFKLQQGCDQRALKRAYGKLLRQFKPERFPSEFKKIREAYEQLQQQIEYGYWDIEDDSQPDTKLGYEIEPEEVVDFDGNVDDVPVYEKSVKPEIKVSIEPTWNDRLETDSPDDLYSELVAKMPKEPEDYLKLAILSDVVSVASDSAEPSLFETWLLRGLEQFSLNHILVHAFRDYVSQLPVARFAGEKQQIQFLVQISKLINTHQFFGTTYSLWMNLIRTASPETIQQTLEQCESHLFDPNENEKLVFYIRIMNALEWRLHEVRRARRLNGEAGNLKKLVSWLLSKRGYLEDHYDLVPYHDLDLIFHDIGLISSYFSSLDQFLDSQQQHYKWRKRLHQMLRDFILNPSDVAEEKLYQFQLSVLKNEQPVLDCFANSVEDDKKFLNLWRWMASTSPGIHLESETELASMRENTKQLLKHTDRVQIPDDPNLNKKQEQRKWIYLITPACIFIPLISGLAFLGWSVDINKMGNEYLVLGIFVLIASLTAISASLGFRYQKKYLAKNASDVSRLISQDDYQQHLQLLWVNFLANNHWQHESLNEIFKAEMVHWESKNTDLLFNYCLKDTGALIVALARRILP